MHVVHDRAVMTLDEAIERVSRLIGAQLDWTDARSVPAVERRRRLPPLGAGLELRRRARTGAAGAARDRAGRGVRAAQGCGRPGSTSSSARSKRPCSPRRSPLTVDEIAAYVGEGDVRRSRSASSPTHYAGRRHRTGRARRPLAFPDRARPRPYPAPRRARSRAACRAPRPRRWRSSPITSRSAAPRSRRSAASRSPRARSTC